MQVKLFGICCVVSVTLLPLRVCCFRLPISSLLKPSLCYAVKQLQLHCRTQDEDGAVRSFAEVCEHDGETNPSVMKAAFDAFRQLFPPALCYTKIVPVDEVISLTLFYREDDHLVRLMLDDEQTRRLDRLWDELHFVSRDALTTVDAFAQLLEYASQDGDPKAFEPLRKPIAERAAAYRQRLVDCEPVQVGKLIDFAALAHRRPLAKKEVEELNALYKKLRGEEIPHEEAFRMMLAKILVSPAFLYRLEKPGPGTAQGPVSDWELASRLSYFLWSSQPDDELQTDILARFSAGYAEHLALEEPLFELGKQLPGAELAAIGERMAARARPYRARG